MIILIRLNACLILILVRYFVLNSRVINSLIKSSEYRFFLIIAFNFLTSTHKRSSSFDFLTNRIKETNEIELITMKSLFRCFFKYRLTSISSSSDMLYKKAWSDSWTLSINSIEWSCFLCEESLSISHLKKTSNHEWYSREIFVFESMNNLFCLFNSMFMSRMNIKNIFTSFCLINRTKETALIIYMLTIVSSFFDVVFLFFFCSYSSRFLSRSFNLSSDSNVLIRFSSNIHFFLRRIRRAWDIDWLIFIDTVAFFFFELNLKKKMFECFEMITMIETKEDEVWIFMITHLVLSYSWFVEYDCLLL